MTAVKFLLVGCLMALVGCGSSKAADKSAAPGGFSVPVVGVVVQPKMVQEKVAVVGSLAANESVELKSEVDGTVSEIHFEEGQEVHKGDVLVVLDRAKLDASLAEAQANSEMAQTTF